MLKVGQPRLDNKAVVIASIWLAVALIATVYMWVFGSRIGDILFGVFLPIGLLVIAAITVTLQVASSPETEKKREA